jgi:uncharacterized protein YkwD
MRRSSTLVQVALLIVFVVSGFGVATTALPAGVDAANYRPDSQECAALKEINRYRASQNRSKLQLSASLGVAASDHSAAQARQKRMYHSNLSRLVAKNGYDGTAFGENVAAGYTSGKSVFGGWRKSAGHNRNMLDGDWKAVGIARDKNGTTYWTAIFGNKVDKAVTC